MDQSDSETTDTETKWSEDSDWDKEDFLKNLYVTASDGRRVDLEKLKLRDKAHHLEVFPKIKIPKSFDLAYSQTSDYKSRLEYVHDRSKLTEKTVFAMQMEAINLFSINTNKVFLWKFKT